MAAAFSNHLRLPGLVHAQPSICMPIVLLHHHDCACVLDAFLALHALVREGNSRAAVQHLQEAATALQQQEPKSAELAYRLVSRVAPCVGSAPFMRIQCLH